MYVYAECKERGLNMLSRYNSSRRAHFVTLGIMLAVMLVFNMLTGLLADDFQYSFSFATGEPIGSFGEAIDSIIAHGEQINGRYFAHFLAQMCLLLPPFVFDIINSFVFVATVLIVYKLCNKGERNNLFLVAIFVFVWIFEQDFGQVNLWLDGSCNYLFAIFFGLIYIIPYLKSTMENKSMSLWLILPHILLSFWFGGYLEMTTVGFVGASCIFLLIDVVYFKKYRSLTLLPSVIAAFLGLAVMVFAPAQSSNKMAEFSFTNLLSTLGVALAMVACIFPIIIIYIILFKRALREKMDKRVLISSLVMAFGALLANFIMVIARYYALRTSMAFVFMSIFATAIIYGNLKDKSISERAKKYAAVFVIIFALAITVGLADNIATAVLTAENTAIIEAAIERGETEVTLYRPVPISKYNGIFGLRYLNITSPDGWPNSHFAKYYGLERVYGKSYFGDIFAFW